MTGRVSNNSCSMAHSSRQTKHIPTRKKTLKNKIGEWLKLAGDVGLLALSLRDKPTKWDWYAAGMRSGSLLLEHMRSRTGNRFNSAYEYFEENEDWESFPREYRKLIVEVAKNCMVAPEFMDSDDKAPYACLASVGKETIGWVIQNGEVFYGPYYQKARKAETFTAFGELVWRFLGGKQLTYDGAALVLDRMKDEGTLATGQMWLLLSQVQRYLKADISRSYLLLGAPGTGKSVAIRWLTSILNMKSLRVNIGALNESTDVAGALQIILGILRPDVLILDDLDRIDRINAELLLFLELARRTCKLVVASANHRSELSGACLRPGRLDELIEFSCLDLPLVKQLLGEFEDLAEQIADLPAAYVTEFANRCKVLGREEALAGLAELRKRAEETAKDADNKDD